jgi:hypothetical protein
MGFVLNRVAIAAELNCGAFTIEDSPERHDQ